MQMFNPMWCLVRGHHNTTRQCQGEQELRWFVVETDALSKMRLETPTVSRLAILDEARRWASSGEDTAKNPTQMPAPERWSEGEWERFAWLKSHVIADTATAGPQVASEDIAALERVVTPFVFRRYMDYEAFEALRDLHEAGRAITQVLSAVSHGRVDYPEAGKGAAGRVS